ncbi:MAG: NAD-dependent epimerase/dehydratase family protein, partial [Victivallales bacterium]|nr:NAD-dependent epimerase/dehydratase family protein [Victivallales bacterium]
KAIVDSDVMERFHRDGFPATVIRPCYITGPGALPLDNLGGRRRDFIPDIINGVELPLPNDGQALLQPIHVEDLAASFVLALANPVSKGQIYNITLDHALPLNRYLQLNGEALGCTVKIRHVPLPQLLEEYPSDPIGMRFLATHMCFTNAKARRELGYSPRHTPEDAVRQTARWTRQHLGV